MMPFSFPALPFELSLWLGARLITFYVVRRPLGNLLRGVTPRSKIPNYVERTPEEIVVSVKRFAARPWLMRKRRCLREGLLAFHYLMLAGHAPILHFGISAASVRTPAPRGHCWISLNGKTVLNPPSEPMVDMFTYDGRHVLPIAESRPIALFDHA